MCTRPTFAAIIVAVLIAAGSPPSARAVPTDDACSLLAQTQVSAALGVTVGPGQPVVPNIPGRPAPTVSKICGWNGGGSATPTDKRVVLDNYDGTIVH